MTASHDTHVSSSPICTLVSCSSIDIENWEASILSVATLDAWRVKKVRRRPHHNLDIDILRYGEPLKEAIL